jgi:hypothetical protein
MLFVSFSLKEEVASGTIMYTHNSENQQQALDGLQGIRPGRREEEFYRTAIIVPLPDWSDISWIECKTQPRSCGGKMVFDSGIKMDIPTTRDGCPMYLTLDRCKEYEHLTEATSLIT